MSTNDPDHICVLTFARTGLHDNCEDVNCPQLDTPNYRLNFTAMHRQMVSQGYSTSLILLAQSMGGRGYWVSEAQVALNMPEGFRMVRTVDDLIIEEAV
jgi:hypothetical protein